MAYLEIIRGKGQGRRFELIAGEYKIGRQPDCDIVLADETVSRVHARVLVRVNSPTMISDENSTNKTIIDGVEVNKNHPLSNGAQIVLGNTTLLYKDGESSSENLNWTTTF